MECHCWISILWWWFILFIPEEKSRVRFLSSKLSSRLQLLYYWLVPLIERCPHLRSPPYIIRFLLLLLSIPRVMIIVVYIHFWLLKETWGLLFLIYHNIVPLFNIKGILQIQWSLYQYITQCLPSVWIHPLTHSLALLQTISLINNVFNYSLPISRWIQ